MYKVIKQWGDGVTGVSGPKIGEIVKNVEDVEGKLEQGMIEKVSVLKKETKKRK